MAAKRKRSPKSGNSGRTAGRIGLRRAPQGNAFELVHPHCARARAEDIEEVQAMIAAGELDVAEEELRWLLDGCHECIAVHKLLGDIAVLDGKLALARSHFGYAFQIAMAALPKEGLAGLLPYRLKANQAFFEAGQKLAWCLGQLGEPKLAIEVVRQLLVLDPSDPLGLRKG
jgi:hypothetical protein